MTLLGAALTILVSCLVVLCAFAGLAGMLAALVSHPWSPGWGDPHDPAVDDSPPGHAGRRLSDLVATPIESEPPWAPLPKAIVLAYKPKAGYRRMPTPVRDEHPVVTLGLLDGGPYRTPGRRDERDPPPPTSIPSDGIPRSR